MPGVSPAEGTADNAASASSLSRGLPSRTWMAGLAEEDLPGVGAIGPFGDQQLRAAGLAGARSARTVSMFCSTVRLTGPG